MPAQLIVSVVEDHDLLREATIAMLKENGFEAVGWESAESVQISGASGSAALYIIDINLPGESGLELARRLRQAQPNAGIVMVTARSDTPDRVEGYRSGADVYMVKPVESAELLAVVSSLKARILPGQADSGWILDRSSLTLAGPAAEVQLTHPEVSLLCGLVQAPAQTLAREEVARHLNLTSEDKHKASMNVRLSQLRKKLRSVEIPDPSLKSLRNRGLLMCFKLTTR